MEAAFLGGLDILDLTLQQTGLYSETNKQRLWSGTPEGSLRGVLWEPPGAGLGLGQLGIVHLTSSPLCCSPSTADGQLLDAWPLSRLL